MPRADGLFQVCGGSLLLAVDGLSAFVILLLARLQRPAGGDFVSHPEARALGLGLAYLNRTSSPRDGRELYQRACDGHIRHLVFTSLHGRILHGIPALLATGSSGMPTPEPGPVGHDGLKSCRA